jgi:hypothetical protein
VSGGGIMVRSRLRMARRASGGFGDFVHDDAVAMVGPISLARKEMLGTI